MGTMNRLQQALHGAKALSRFAPLDELSSLWRKDVRGRVLRDGTHLREAVQFAQAHQLHQCIAMRRRLVRPGDHRHIERISQPLVQPCITRSTA